MVSYFYCMLLFERRRVFDVRFQLFFFGQTENSNKRRVLQGCYAFYPSQSRLQPPSVTSFHLLNSCPPQKAVSFYWPTVRALCLCDSSPKKPHYSLLALCLPATPASSHGPLLPLWRRAGGEGGQASKGCLRGATHHSQLIMAIVLVWVLHFTVQCS